MNRCLPILSALMLIAFSVGCEQHSEIRRYKVAKAPKEAQVAVVESGEPSRMLAAILFEGQQSWFFKLTGAPDNAASAVDGFQSLLKSIKFVDGAPKWTLPEGWKAKESSSSMRFATLAVPGDDGTMELSVIPLPFVGGEDDSLTSNINRWRGQLSLPAQKLDALKSDIESVEYDGGVANFVDITGTAGSGGGMGGAPFAPFAGGQAGGRLRPPAGPAERAVPPSRPKSSNPVTMTAPDGWSRSSNDTFSALAYDLADGGRFTVTRLSGPGAKDQLQNVNRWRRQVGLEGLTAEQMDKDAEPVNVDGQDGIYVKAVGEEKAIFGALVSKADEVWFFKLTGPTAAIEAEREHFEQALKTIKFPTK